MRLLLAWFVAQCLGVLAAFFGYLGLATAEPLSLLPPDRLAWLVLTLTGFAVFDFARRATSPEAWQVRGAHFAWIVSINMLIMLAAGGVFGVLAGRQGVRNAMQALPAVVGENFLVAMAAAFSASIAYVLLVEFRMIKGGPR